MKIMANGVQQEVNAPISVAEYLALKGYEKTLISVELNFKSLPRDKWASVMLEEGDNLEIIRFIGGG